MFSSSYSYSTRSRRHASTKPSHHIRALVPVFLFFFYEKRCHNWGYRRKGRQVIQVTLISYSGGWRMVASHTLLTKRVSAGAPWVQSGTRASRKTHLIGQQTGTNETHGRRKERMGRRGPRPGLLNDDRTRGRGWTTRKKGTRPSLMFVERKSRWNAQPCASAVVARTCV